METLLFLQVSQFLSMLLLFEVKVVRHGQAVTRVAEPQVDLVVLSQS